MLWLTPLEPWQKLINYVWIESLKSRRQVIYYLIWGRPLSWNNRFQIRCSKRTSLFQVLNVPLLLCIRMALICGCGLLSMPDPGKLAPWTRAERRGPGRRREKLAQSYLFWWDLHPPGCLQVHHCIGPMKHYRPSLLYKSRASIIILYILVKNLIQFFKTNKIKAHSSIVF